jgi:hypothetical protein
MKKVKVEVLFHVLLTSAIVWTASSAPCSDSVSPVTTEWKFDGSQGWCENDGEKKNQCCCYQILYVYFAVKVTGMQYESVIGHASESTWSDVDYKAFVRRQFE